MSDVELKQVSKRFGDVEAVCDLSFAVRSGEFMVLLGPTGAGKTRGWNVLIVAPLRSTAGMRAGNRRRRATWRSSFSNIRSIRI